MSAEDALAADVDASMDPAASSSLSPSSKAKEAEIHEKYRSLKRRFFELEEETSTELLRSGERNAKMREERNILLDRIIELEAQPGFVMPAGSPTETSPSGAFPRSLLDAHARTSFTDNLRAAAAEDDADADAEIDPTLSSRHVQNDDATIRRSPRRTRGNKNKDADGEGDPSTQSPVMVSTTGTRLRIRPVGGGEEGPSSASSSRALDATRSASPDSEGMPVDDENDDSGEYSPHSKGNKRPRLSKDYTGDGLVAVPPEPKATRRSSRRSAAATAPSVSRTRVIQAPKSAGTRAKPAAAAPPADSGGGESAPPKAESPALDSGAGINGHVPPASPMTRPANLAFNPYYPYLAPSPSTAPNPYVNPYAYYMPPPMPAAYMPPPQFAPPRPPAEAPRAAKPKRLKAHTVTSKSYSIPMVPRDKSGKPMLPLNVGIMTVISLGAVCMREHFHTERYIFPVGYEVTRRYLSTVDVAAEVVYHCTILDGGDGPKFQIIPSDVPDRPIIAGTATGAWSAIVKQANAIRQRAHSNSVSGPDFFGLGQNTIKHLIQELPNADRLRDYVWQQFVEGGPLGGRHAAVIPALPEEYEGGRLVGAYYPPRETQEGEKRGNYYPPHILAQAASAPPPQKRPEYRDGSRVVMPPGGGPIAGGSGGGGNYYLPHTQQQGRASPPEPLGYPGPPNGSPYPPGANNNGNGSFASIMNAFPTQQNGNGGEGGGGP